MMKNIMVQVIDMKSSTGAIWLCEEKVDAVEPMWTNYLTELHPNYYE